MAMVLGLIKEKFQSVKDARIRSNCCLWSKPDSYSGLEDQKLGKLKVSRWDNLHFRSSTSHDMSLIQVQRHDDKGYAKKRRPLWLVWVGEQFLELTDIWAQYARRFRVDHW